MRGTKPTVRQKKLMKEKGLNPDDWLVTSDTHERLKIKHRHSDRTMRTIWKDDKNA